MSPAPLPCLEERCPLPAARDGRCRTHFLQRRRTQDQLRPGARARGYDERWARTRAAYLAAHPRCEHPGCGAPATDVHHVDGLGPRGPRGHDPCNLAAFCRRHHSDVTVAMQPGGWNR